MDDPENVLYPRESWLGSLYLEGVLVTFWS